MEPFRIDQEMTAFLAGLDDEQLRSFGELNEDPANDEQIELYIYICFLIFAKTRSTEHLERAIVRAEGWIAEVAADHRDYGRRFHILDMISARMIQHGFIEDARLDIVQRHEQALSLGRTYLRTCNTAQLNEAIRIMEQATDIAGGYVRPDTLNDLGVMLGERFERTGSLDDLNRAVDIASQAVDGTPQDHPDRAGPLGNLGNWLGKRFERTGSLDDLNRAVDIISQAVDGTPQDHPDRAGRLSNLGSWLGRRFERTGSLDDLNRAVDITSQVVDGTPQDHPDRAGRLNNLGNSLGTRFERTGSLDDLNRAVDTTGQAVDAIPQDHPDRAVLLNNLGNSLGTRFERTGSLDDLNRSVDVTSQAVDGTPQDHPYRAGRLSNLGSWLGRRFERTGSLNDLNRAVDTTGQAVDGTPQDHPDRAGRLSNLGSWLGRRFERTGSLDDLNRAVDTTGQAVDAIPQDHPDRAVLLNNLGSWLSRRFERTGSLDDLNRMLSSHREAWSCCTAPLSTRIFAARRTALLLITEQDWEGSSQLLQEALDLLPAVSPRSLKHTDKQHNLADLAGIASLAAATSLSAGKDADHALRLLEFGRGIIAGLLMDMRGDITDLKQRHPSLAEEFILLRDELDSPEDQVTSLASSDNISSWESQVKRRREANQKLDELITKIRAEPGFDNFLLPPTADDLMATANLGPIIVINLSPYRCDAFLVERGRIRVLELPDLTMKEVEKRVSDLRVSRLAGSFHIAPLLEWLWDVAARPSLDALGFKDSITDDNWPRVWWIPTGLLGQLPLHAAGQYGQASTETVLDRVMSSYASSIKSLIHGRRHVRSSAGPLSDQALLVAMHKTPNLWGSGTLPFAADEIKMLTTLCPSLQLRPVTPTLYKDDVLQHLSACRIFHFAGHGQSDGEEPSRSCLLLNDWNTDPLTVGDLRDRRLQEHAPFLGYLSACSTGVNEAVKLADENIHLVSALQLAGFRHVVGTLWEVSDKHCVDAARIFYETLRDEGMTDTAVCRGLHRAVRALRDKAIEEGNQRNAILVSVKTTRARGMVDVHWVPYVHFGV